MILSSAIRQSLAFLKKDFQVETSYRISFFFNIFGVVTSLLGYFFIDKLFGWRITPHLQEFGVSYFSYVLVGMAFFSYIGAGIGSFSGRLQSEQVQGTLEAILMTPCKISVFLLSMILWNLVFATVDLLLYILAGIFLFSIDFSHVNGSATITVLALAILSFSSLGIISASFILSFKRGNPLGWVINTMEGLLGGVYFPVSIMPLWLQAVAKLLPITYAIRAIQLAVYKGYTVMQLAREILFLVAFSALLLPSAVMFFSSSLKRARRNGSLAQY